ncbi:hypothetical protein TRIATDRAFT_301868 [Trichoderma atroviride IMI 206040]|uniref:Uncharacterized protein n=1 Tax=Hypocrea atroviridis (strain ATCC 20476 / IMI 206040) TaxID=452589 RepID=G9P507_HYPAI|nr:uncharacterized protein TRIATDRAFT_301868 [Trichoderma atroviride IMI 206040]EHK41247.1 hypothetical protein TRIATDRAFT_301868 [Trichoderma atroviride IMI 206040]
MDASDVRMRDCFPTAGHRSHSLQRACKELHESKHEVPSEADPRATWLLCIYITCMQTEMLIFTGRRFLRGQLAVRNWNAYHPVHG